MIEAHSRFAGTGTHRRKTAPPPGTDYDWRRAAKLNACPQFGTNINGLDIRFVQTRSRHAHAAPLLATAARDCCS
jgi:hypothetical protein